VNRSLPPWVRIAADRGRRRNEPEWVYVSGHGNMWTTDADGNFRKGEWKSVRHDGIHTIRHEIDVD
jgi:hypothetical protein